MSQSEYSTFIKSRLVELVHDLKEKVAQKDQTIEKQGKLIGKLTSIVTNKNQSYSDRVQAACLTIGHPEEVLSGQAFDLDVEEERKKSGLSNKAAATFFNAMKEAGGIQYTAEQTKKVDSNGKVYYSTVSTITFNENFDIVNTRATSTKETLREEEKARVEARMQKLATPVCPSCHSDEHISIAPVPICMKCEVQMEPIEEPIPVAELCRIVEDAIESIPTGVREWVAKNKDLITLAIDANGAISMANDYQTPDVISYIQANYDVICSVLKEVA